MAHKLRDSRGILQDSRELLATARFGMSLVNSDDPNETRIGIRNVVVFGRAVTIALQNLRSTEADFEIWYEPWVTRMKCDAVMVHLNKVRSEILKEGNLKTSITMQFNFGDTPFPVERLMQNPPPGARAFFVGDSNGGSGWEVVLPGGGIEKYYISLQDFGIDLNVSLYFADAPTELENRTISDVCEHYLGELSRILDDASSKFGN